MTTADRIPAADPSWIPPGWEPDPEPGTLLEHVRAVWPHGEDRAATASLAASLGTYSTAYAGLKTADLTRALKAVGVVPRTLKIAGKSARGVRLADLDAAPAAPRCPVATEEPERVGQAAPEPAEPSEPLCRTEQDSALHDGPGSQNPERVPEFVELWSFTFPDGRHVQITPTPGLRLTLTGDRLTAHTGPTLWPLLAVAAVAVVVAVLVGVTIGTGL